ncbi:hypothetical protein J2X28_002307 [Kocuria rhizophila]|uniref:hypothetical protein n=1 Tax=Kocuria rhizophila TaxID=72000 RepID=UPI00285E42CF|nr:hypothetical protein [Kocuria rhizophila]MDR7375302.1 hypothetical protein [Kocuria rhizophila]
MQLSDFNLTAEQRDQILTEEINRRVRKGATLLVVDEGTALVRYGPEPSPLDLVYLVALWGFNILLTICSLGFWGVLLALFWAMFHRTWRKAEGIKVHETGQVEVFPYGKTLAYITEANLRRHQV